MRIGIDARELSGHVTGVGRFLGGLLREWQTASAERHEFVLYAPAPVAVTLDEARFRMHIVPGGSGTWWEQRALPQAIRTDGLDVFFAPAYTAPLGITVPTVAAIYDLSYMAHPEWFRVREGLRRRWLTQETAARARAVITLSEFSRGEIRDRLGVAGDRVHVIRPGVDRLVATRKPTSEPRVLFVGSIFNRRHVPDLIRAVAAVASERPATSLDIVGDNRTFPHEDIERAVTAAQLDGQIRWHRYATEDVLAGLYSRARAFAFLSEYEGLGLTPLEALASGIPPVLYDTPVSRESCGAAALYVPVADRSATAAALHRVLFDEPTRTRLLAAAPKVLARYNWPRAAMATLAIIEAAGAR